MGITSERKKRKSFWYYKYEKKEEKLWVLQVRGARVKD